LGLAALPEINAVTTQTHLGITLAQGNWVYAGFDLTMLRIVTLLGLTGWYASHTPTSRKPAKRKASEPLNLPAEAERA
jgi:hypothetical protein